MTKETKRFLSSTATLVLPMAVQNLINTSVNAADVVMLGRTGKIALSAASLGGQVYFILSLIFFGLASGASVLTAQYWGKRDTVTIEKILGFTMRISFLIALAFTIVVLAFPETVMRIFSSEDEVIRAGAGYLRIIALSYIASAITTAYLNLMRSIEKVIISTVVYSCSLIINIIINAVLIFGLLGFPAMGVRGAAIGTLIARFSELIFVLIYASKFNKTVRIRIKYIFRTDRLLKNDFFTYSLPVVVNELFWGTGISVLSAIIGHMGSSVTAANSVAQVVRQLAMVVLFGLANAAAIMIGKAIGSGHADTAEEYAGRFIKLTLVLGIISSLIILLISPAVRSFMTLEADSAEYLKQMLYVMSYFVIAQSISTVSIVGIFRAGGDTKIGLLFDVGSMWFISLPLGAVSAFVLKLPVFAVYMILCSDEIIKVPFCLWRYKSKKWLRNVTR
ncbi:MAG: MATE family efflux transporter [bacterium]|nr:MATE family efflux transporter [bacterium]